VRDPASDEEIEDDEDEIVISEPLPPSEDLQLARAVEILKSWASYEHLKKARIPAAPVASVPQSAAPPQP
jgi:hypothetical protein